MSAALPLGYVAPAIGSRVLVEAPFHGGATEAIVLAVYPNAATRLPMVYARYGGTATLTTRTAEWAPLGAVETRCGTCYRVVPEGQTIDEHAATSDEHAFFVKQAARS